MNSPANASASRKRVWCFRALAVSLALALFAVIELVCIALGVGEARLDVDPYVGFSSTVPLFERTADESRFQIAKSRRAFFAHDSFPANKSSDARRVFCLGGSTVQGRPFSIQTSFTTWLQIALNAADESHDWDVVNCGGISYASYRLVPILAECLRHQPDAIILCTGHNEFLEERTYGDVKQRARWLASSDAAMSGFRSFRLLRQVLADDEDARIEAESTARPNLPEEVDALLDYCNGLSAFQRDDEWRQTVLEHFEFNVRRMVRMCQQADVPVLLIAPPSNLADCPPFKSEHRADLSEADQHRWVELVNAARAAIRDDSSAAVDLYRQAHEIDDRFASTHYELGKCLEALGRSHEARAEFIRARDEDICPLRILSPMFAALPKVASDFDIPFLDAHEHLEVLSQGTSLGDFLLVDHVHPSFRGHQEIAIALLKRFESTGLIPQNVDWEPTARDRFQEHFEGLDEMYFPRGQRMLEALQEWTKGRADGPAIESR